MNPNAPASTAPAGPSDGIPVHACPLCHGKNFRRVAAVKALPLVRCDACLLHFASPQPTDAALAQIYGPDYMLAADGSALAAEFARSKRATADRYLDLLATHGVAARGRLLDAGCGAGHFLQQAARRGFEVTGVEYSPSACQRARATLGNRSRILQGEIAQLRDETAAYDVAVLCDVLEHVRNPAEFLRQIHRLLRPGGTLLVAAPSLDSWSARLMGSRWMEYKAEHLFYFDRRTIARLLGATGFSDVALHRGIKMLSLEYVAAHFERYPVPLVTPVMKALRKFSPRPLRQRLFAVVASGFIALARQRAS